MANEEFLIQTLLKELSQTKYACSDLTKLNGGTANFLYRGNLLKPLNLQDEGAEIAIRSVIIKRSEEFSPGNPDFLLDITRCVWQALHLLAFRVRVLIYPNAYQRFEESMLHGLAQFSYITHLANTVVRSPGLYLFNQKTNTQVLEDCSDTTDLRTILLSPTIKDILPGASPASLGYDVGSWLRCFHQWTSAPEQASLRDTIRQNTEARKLKRKITHDSFVGILEAYPVLVERRLETLKAIQTAMAEWFELSEPPDGGDGSLGLIHGDFWTGNILVPNAKWQESQPPGRGANRLFIIDWELAQFGHRAIDIGGMLADLYERKHFNGSDAAISVMEGFASGYGQISDEMAFRIAIHAGVHLICWHIRGNPKAPLSAPTEKVLSALALGRDWILKGWEKDRSWFQDSVLAPILAEH